MSTMSQRLSQAVDYITDNVLAKDEGSIAQMIGVPQSWLSMAKNGRRKPDWKILVKLCRVYPIDLEWLISGEGDMIVGRRDQLHLARVREIQLNARIAELEKEIEKLQNDCCKGKRP